VLESGGYANPDLVIVEYEPYRQNRETGCEHPTDRAEHPFRPLRVGKGSYRDGEQEAKERLQQQVAQRSDDAEPPPLISSPNREQLDCPVEKRGDDEQRSKQVRGADHGLVGFHAVGLVEFERTYSPNEGCTTNNIDALCLKKNL